MSTENETARSGQKLIWRSLDHKADAAKAKDAACGSDVVKRNIDQAELFTINRRKFLTAIPNRERRVVCRQSCANPRDA